MDAKRRKRRIAKKGPYYGRGIAELFGDLFDSLYSKTYNFEKSKHTKRKISRGWVDGGMESNQGASSGGATVVYPSWPVGKP